MKTDPRDAASEISPAVREHMARLGAVRHAPGDLPEEVAEALPPAYREWITEWTWPENVDFSGPDDDDDDWEERVAEDPEMETFTDQVYGAWCVSLGQADSIFTINFASGWEKYFGEDARNKLVLVDSSRRWLQIGVADGGNYAILLELDDANPADPGVHVVDHEMVPESLWGEEYREKPLPLSMFLKYLNPKAADEDGDEDYDDNDEENDDEDEDEDE